MRSPFQQRERPNRQMEQIQMMMAMDQLGQNDIQSLGSMSQMMQEPLKTELLQQQIQHAPQMEQAKLDATQMGGISDLANGLSYATPQLAPQVIKQMLQKYGYYQPNPEEDLARTAAAYGISIDQARAMAQRMMQ